MTDISHPLLTTFREFLSVHRRVSGHTVSDYLRDVSVLLAHYPSPDRMTLSDCHHFLGLPVNVALGTRSQQRRLSAIRTFWRYLTTQYPGLANPWVGIKPARMPRRLPRTVPTDTLMSFLDQVPTHTPEGIRLRAMLELVFGTGIRVGELVRLQLADWRGEEHGLRVWGKGQKERLVVVGPTASRWVGLYVSQVRSLWALSSQPALWVSKRGSALTARSVQRMIKAEGLRQGVSLTPHVLRHSFATAMLEGGASLDVIQQLLGHASIDATQVYTHVSRRRLSTLHQQSPLGHTGL
ncbi:hypothetical protein EBZ35_01730 [bacterium]|nr:hypothetical protein [bacterium]